MPRAQCSGLIPITHDFKTFSKVDGLQGPQLPENPLMLRQKVLNAMQKV